MGVYVYTARKRTARLVLPGGAVTEACLVKYFTKPYWDVWEDAVNQSGTGPRSGGPFDFEGKRRRALYLHYRREIVRTERMDVPEYGIIGDRFEDGCEVLRLNRKALFYDTWEGEEIVGIVRKRGRVLSLVPYVRVTMRRDLSFLLPKRADEPGPQREMRFAEGRTYRVQDHGDRYAVPADVCDGLVYIEKDEADPAPPTGAAAS